MNQESINILSISYFFPVNRDYLYFPGIITYKIIIINAKQDIATKLTICSEFEGNFSWLNCRISMFEGEYKSCTCYITY